MYALLRHVRPLVLSSERVVARQVKPLGWTVGMRAVAEVLDEIGPSTVPQVAARLDLPRQAVQRLVDDLGALGHVATEPNPAHRRSVLVRLTADGQQAFGTLKQAELERLARLVPDVSAADLAVATRVLAALDDDVRTLVQEGTADG